MSLMTIEEAARYLRTSSIADTMNPMTEEGARDLRTIEDAMSPITVEGARDSGDMNVTGALTLLFADALMLALTKTTALDLMSMSCIPCIKAFNGNHCRHLPCVYGAGKLVCKIWRQKLEEIH